MGLDGSLCFLDDSRMLRAAYLARVSGAWSRISLAFCELALSCDARSVQGVDVHRFRGRAVSHRLAAVSTGPHVPD